MKILNAIKKKIKAIAAKIVGEPPAPNFATIIIKKNGEQVFTIESTSPDIVDGLFDILSYFNKYDDYKIIYDYVSRAIYIYFNVKKNSDVECADSSNKKTKKEG